MPYLDKCMLISSCPYLPACQTLMEESLKTLEEKENTNPEKN